MEFEAVKEWLDKLVSNMDEMRSLRFLNNKIELCVSANYIHIFTGIEIIADVMGIKLNVKHIGGGDYPYKYSFNYRGYEIIQLENKPIEGVTDGTD